MCFARWQRTALDLSHRGRPEADDTGTTTNPALCNHSFICSPSKPCQTWPSWTTYSTRSCDMRSTMSSRPPGLQHASDLAHHLRGIGDEVRDEKQHRGVERVVVDRERLRSSRCEARRSRATRDASAPRRASVQTRRPRSRVATHGASASRYDRRRSRGRRRPSSRRADRAARAGRCARRSCRRASCPRCPTNSRKKTCALSRRLASTLSARRASCDAPASAETWARTTDHRSFVGSSSWLGDHLIEAARAFAAGDEPAVVGEELEVAAHRRLRELQDRAQLSDRELVSVEEQKNAASRRVSEDERRSRTLRPGGIYPYIRMKRTTCGPLRQTPA